MTVFSSRAYVAVPLAVVGVVVIAGSLAAGYWGQAAFAAVAFPLVIGLVGWSRSPAATTLLDDDDERAHGIIRDAAAIAFLVLLLAVSVGGVTEVVRGEVGPWRVVLVTGAVSFVVSFLALTRRR